jgi:hypothetical protein
VHLAAAGAAVSFQQEGIVEPLPAQDVERNGAILRFVADGMAKRASEEAAR